MKANMKPSNPPATTLIMVGDCKNFGELACGNVCAAHFPPRVSQPSLTLKKLSQKAATS